MREKLVINKTVVIKSDATIGYLEPFKGHTFIGLREIDSGTAVKPEKGAYVLEFSSEPAQEQLLTIEEQQLALESFKHQAKTGGPMGSYAGFHCLMADRLIPDADGGE